MKKQMDSGNFIMLLTNAVSNYIETGKFKSVSLPLSRQWHG